MPDDVVELDLEGGFLEEVAALEEFGPVGVDLAALGARLLRGVQRGVVGFERGDRVVKPRRRLLAAVVPLTCLSLG